MTPRTFVDQTPGVDLPPGIEILAPAIPAAKRVLTPEALAFVARLARAFEPRRQELLARRKRVQQALDRGTRPTFLPETAHVRASEWMVAPLPHDLLDRRVEITGPVDRKMIINALNSGASVFMADFEDANSPTWSNCIEGQANLMDAVRRTITFEATETGKSYKLNEKTATLLVRPRGWHLDEAHVHVDGKPVSASLFDFALYFCHNAKELVARKSGPYFYLPKMESHLEARLWNDAFLMAQNELGIPRGTIKATVLIETILSAFEMDEILYELREHSAGLNCGRWDYIFSFIKKFSADARCVMPDRARVTMTEHFLRSYSLLLIQTCHRRGVHAMGGMAAQIPIKNDPARNAAATEKVRADKLREATDGHDGTWVAHPALVEVAKAVFDEHMPAQNQITSRPRTDVRVNADDLLCVPSGAITAAGLRQNVGVGVRYLASWLQGQGAVPLYDLMEDAATAEISRAQLWQWIRHGARLDDGRQVTADMVRGVLAEELELVRREIGDARYASARYDLARTLFERLVTARDFEEFLTQPAYAHIVSTRN
ncbi:MAG: malate synthase A [Planctomycetota bacterium]